MHAHTHTHTHTHACNLNASDVKDKKCLQIKYHSIKSGLVQVLVVVCNIIFNKPSF